MMSELSQDIFERTQMICYWICQFGLMASFSNKKEHADKNQAQSCSADLHLLVYSTTHLTDASYVIRHSILELSSFTSNPCDNWSPDR